MIKNIRKETTYYFDLDDGENIEMYDEDEDLGWTGMHYLDEGIVDAVKKTLAEISPKKGEETATCPYCKAPIDESMLECDLKEAEEFMVIIKNPHRLLTLQGRLENIEELANKETTPERREEIKEMLELVIENERLADDYEKFGTLLEQKEIELDASLEEYQAKVLEYRAKIKGLSQPSAIQK